jgi:CheY-like chemotaxis protein
LPEESQIGVGIERGNETILLVEDQKSVRSFTGAALKEYGYHVIEASDGDEATAVAEEYAGEIHLLLTDVVMPGISGKEASERMKEVRPNLKVLFMSGYTADVIAQRGVLDRSVAFLHKPFSPVQLAAKVREVLAQSS